MVKLNGGMQKESERKPSWRNIKKHSDIKLLQADECDESLLQSSGI